MSDEKPKFQAEVVRAVSVSVLQLKNGIPAHIRINEPIHTGKEMKAKEGEAAKKPAEVGLVTNLETGSPHTFVYGAVLKSQLEELYPDTGYVGKCFKVTKLGKREGKGYNDYEVFEIKDPDAKAKTK